MPVAHGTRTCYVQGCRRDECREAENEYRRAYRQKYPAPFKAAHQRVWELYGQGASTKAIAEDTGYCITHVRRILQGKFKYEPQ